MTFHFDNPVFRALGKLVDCCYVSLLWLVCSLPVVTFGAATSALYYTVHKSIRGGRGYVGRSFFHSFRENFKQAILSWLVVLLILFVLVSDAILLRQGALFYFCILTLVFVIGFCCVLFPYIARFENTVKNTLRNSLFLEIRHLPWTFVLLLVLALVLFCTWLIPFLILVLPAFTFLLYDVILERIFRRYMSPEDLEREMEIEKLDKQEDLLN